MKRFVLNTCLASLISGLSAIPAAAQAGVGVGGGEWRWRHGPLHV